MTSDHESASEVASALDNFFLVPLPVAEAWPILSDIARIAPCIPGVELTEIIDDKTYRGTLSVGLGPVTLPFAGMVRLEELDPVTCTARVSAEGEDAKDNGGAHATASFKVEEADGGCKVLVHTDLALSGDLAEMGRGSVMIQAAAAHMVRQFADNLCAQIASGGRS